MGKTRTTGHFSSVITVDAQDSFTFPKNVSAESLISRIANGTAPLSVVSSTVVTNLNADMLDGYHASAFALASIYPNSGLTTGYVPYKTAGVLANSPIYTNGTNVGIGTPNPGAKFVVSSSGASGYEISPNYASSNITLIENYNRSTALYEPLRTIASYHRFDVNGTETMRLTDNVTITSLASTKPRLVIASATGQLSGIVDGTAGQVLQTDGNGVYSFSSISSSYQYWALSANMESGFDPIYNNTRVRIIGSGGTNVSRNNAEITISSPAAYYWWAGTGAGGSAVNTGQYVHLYSAAGGISMTYPGGAIQYNLDFLPLAGGTLTGAVTNSSTFTGSNFILNSDVRLKTSIEKLGVKQGIESVNLVQYRMKNELSKLRFGVIAQELEKIMPELVNTDKDGFKSVSYIDLLIAKVAYLENEIKHLKAR